MFLSCHKSENHIQKITNIVQKNISSLKTKYNCDSDKCLFLAFWDFDGTLLKGDCSEGLTENNKTEYKGLVQLGIKAGLSIGSAPESFQKIWKFYRRLEEKDPIKAYVFLPSLFSGQSYEILRAFSDKQFNNIYKHYLFKSSVKILQSLNDLKIESHIISASGEVFVKSASRILPIKLKNIHGIKLKITNDTITDKVVFPITYAEGKTLQLLKVIETYKSQKKYTHIFVVAGFGNSYKTDGPFLKYIASTPYGIGVMINGGKTPLAYASNFIRVTQKRLL